MQDHQPHSEDHFVVKHLFGADKKRRCNSAGACRVLASAADAWDSSAASVVPLPYNSTAAALGLLELKALVRQPALLSQPTS